MSLDKFVFSDFDFSELSSPDFKEDSVREELVKPLLNALGYSVSGRNKIRRSKALKHPFVKVGAGKREITVIPDYLLEVSGKYAWVLDAKSPDEEVKEGTCSTSPSMGGDGRDRDGVRREAPANSCRS
jgi:hypothetical protein